MNLVSEYKFAIKADSKNDTHNFFNYEENTYKKLQLPGQYV